MIMQESCLFNNAIDFQQVIKRCSSLSAISVKRVDKDGRYMSGAFSTGHGILSVEALKLNA